jgi:hypothetical protein
MVLDEARRKLERYVRQMAKLLGLDDLSEGLEDLRDFLEGDNSPKDKERARNLVRTYRNETLGQINTQLFRESGQYVDPYTAAYCREAIELFDVVNELVSVDDEFNAVKQKVARLCKQLAEKEDSEVSVRDIIDKVLSLNEAEQKVAVDLLRKIGLHIESRLAKEKARRLASRPVPADHYNTEEYGHAGLTMQIFEFRVQGAIAHLAVRSGAYVILKGSTALEQERESMPDNARRTRRDLMREGILILDQRTNLLMFKDDVKFDSPSAASNAISASSTNGLICFKMPNGKTLKQIMHR